MPTDSCDRCGDGISTPLLRDIELRVDGAEVDEQAVCPDCFADWIAHYQEQLAGDATDAAEAERVETERTDRRTEYISAARERRDGDNEIREVGRLPDADEDGSGGDADDPEDDGRPRLR